MFRAIVILTVVSTTAAESNPLTWGSVIRQHCSTLPDTEPESSELLSIPPGPRGPVGIPGAPGKSGRRGPPGPPVVLNKSRMSDLFDESLSAVSQLYSDLEFGEIPEDYDAKSAYQSRRPTPKYTEWTVFQRRKDGATQFHRNWNDYVVGFGSTDSDFWLGLEDIHQQTKSGYHELRIDMIATNGTYLTASYGSFRLLPASDHYKIVVSGYSGNATDGLSYHNGSPFTTMDADHDDKDGRNCAKRNKGGWWYKRCLQSSLNGRFNRSKGSKGMRWYNSDTETDIRLSFSEMKFREAV